MSSTFTSSPRSSVRAFHSWRRAIGTSRFACVQGGSTPTASSACATRSRGNIERKPLVKKETRAPLLLGKELGAGDVGAGLRPRAVKCRLGICEQPFLTLQGEVSGDFPKTSGNRRGRAALLESR